MHTPVACLFAAFIGFGAASVGWSVDYPARPDVVARVNEQTRTVEEVIGVGRDPLSLVVAGGAVWVHNVEDGNVYRIDPATNDATVVGPRAVVAIAAAGRNVWVAYGGNRLARLDGRGGRIEHAVRIGAARLFRKRDAGFPAFARGAVWITVPVLGKDEAPQRLVRVDPVSGEATTSLAIPADPGPPLVAGRFLWIVGRYDNVLSRVDTATRRVRTVSTGFLPFGVAVGGGSIWVAHDYGTSVWRFDPVSLRVRARIATGERARGIAYGKDRVWVATETGISVIDPGSNRVVSRVPLSPPVGDDGPIGVGLLGDDVWVSVE